MSSITEKKVFAVLGATGHQGGSVIRQVLSSPNLSERYAIRALTRDPSSPSAQALRTLASKKNTNIEVVAADATSQRSLLAAFKDAHTVFSVTTPTFGSKAIAVETEFNTAKLIADTAAEVGVEHFIWSTLTSISDASGGKYTAVTAFDAKAKAETYIRGLAREGKFKIGASFFAAGSYMENFKDQAFLAPVKVKGENGEETWELRRPGPSGGQMPLIAAGRDIGKFVGAILDAPHRYATTTGTSEVDGRGRVLCAATRMYTFEEIVDILSKTVRKRVVYKQVSVEEFRKSLEMLPANLGDIFVDAYLAMGSGDIGYFGRNGEEEVPWAASQVEGELMEFEDFLRETPLELM